MGEKSINFENKNFTEIFCKRAQNAYSNIVIFNKKKLMKQNQLSRKKNDSKFIFILNSLPSLYTYTLGKINQVKLIWEIENIHSLRLKKFARSALFFSLPIRCAHRRVKWGYKKPLLESC